ncbi:MAG: WD40 repeat domain-containing protein [Promethearchaeota archaeon]|nr:MAG: WD40 repeat domain-containing protein [Candidatus Lokiarchaeota archaeon]
MKEKINLFIIISILMLSSINILAANIPQELIMINSQNDNSINSLSIPKESAEGDITSIWNYTFPNPPQIVAISKDGKNILGINDSTVNIFHRNSNATLWTYDVGERINDQAMSFNGRYIVLGDNRKNVTLLDSISKTDLWHFNDTSGGRSVYVDISQDGNYIAVANDSGGVYLFDNGPSVGQKNPKWYYDDGTSRIYTDVAISGNDQYIITGDFGGNITLFNTATSIPKTYEWQFNTTNIIRQVVFSYDGKHFIASNNDKEVYLFNTTNPHGKPMWNFTSPEHILTIDISSDGKKIVVCDSTYLYYFNNSFQAGNKTAKWRYSILGDPDPVPKDVAISKFGEYVVMGTFNPTFYLFNSTKTTPKMPKWKIPILMIESVDISPLGDYLVFASGEPLDGGTNTIYLYHQDIPIPKGLLLLLGDDDDDDDEEEAIPYGNYYLGFAVIAIVGLIIIMKKKVLIKQNK